MDHAKSPRRALHQLRPLARFDALVVDAAFDPDILGEMREHLPVTVADPV